MLFFIHNFVLLLLSRALTEGDVYLFENGFLVLERSGIKSDRWEKFVIGYI